MDPVTPPPDSQFSYSRGSMTVTQPIIPLCCVPQYSAQNQWYRPGLVALNQVVLKCPSSTAFSSPPFA